MIHLWKIRHFDKFEKVVLSIDAINKGSTPFEESNWGPGQGLDQPWVNSPQGYINLSEDHSSVTVKLSFCLSLGDILSFSAFYQSIVNQFWLFSQSIVSEF